MCIFLDSKSNKFKVGCLVCNKSVLCQDVEGYGTMKDVLADSLMRVAIVHQIGYSAVSWLNEELIDIHQVLGQTLYCLHLYHLSESNVSGVNPCLQAGLNWIHVWEWTR